jgi:FAD/FMN-containing dehydrogenase
MIDRHPILIARCVDVADIIAAVNFARENEISLAIRGGGHNVAGLGTCDDGIVVDLSYMRSVRVDPVNRTAHVAGGCNLGDVDHATYVFGLATPLGIASITGVAGLTLGGGVGVLSRKYGLTCDNLISVDMVMADGSFLVASEKENSDLFWAVRGGGGNFGVVTSFQFRLHPISEILGGTVFYPIDMAGDVMRFYRDFIAEAPPELGAIFGFRIGMPIPSIPKKLQGVTMCAIVSCYSGPMEKAEEVVRPIREFGPPLLDTMEVMPFPVFQSLADSMTPRGLQHYWKADFVNELNDGIIEGHTKYGPQIPNYQSAVNVFPIDTAVHKFGKNETAFSYRDANFLHVIAAMYPDPADTPNNIAWAKDYWNALHPHSAGGAYVNFLMDEGQDRIKATYRDNYDRLTKIKGKYDPNNLFHINQNIKPKK